MRAGEWVCVCVQETWVYECVCAGNDESMKQFACLFHIQTDERMFVAHLGNKYTHNTASLTDPLQSPVSLVTLGLAPWLSRNFTHEVWLR